jgi:hypothetical protein
MLYGSRPLHAVLVPLTIFVGLGCSGQIFGAAGPDDSVDPGEPGTDEGGDDPGAPGGDGDGDGQGDDGRTDDPVPLAACDRYAAPAPHGAADGKTEATAYLVADFWPEVTAAFPEIKTLCLVGDPSSPARYRGDASMIDPPDGLGGTASDPITVRALHDGGVLLDGEGARRPIAPSDNDRFIVEGVNACCTDADAATAVVAIGVGSAHNVIRRVCAWKASLDYNNDIFGIHGGDDPGNPTEHNLLEDVAAWGEARKIYQSSQHGEHTTIRRAWGRWEGSINVGPKMTYTIAYNNQDMTCENCLGTWSAEKMPQNYTLEDNGAVYTGGSCGSDGCQHRGGSIDQAYGIFAMDGFTDYGATTREARSGYFGSLAYVRGGDDFDQAYGAVFLSKLDDISVIDTAVYLEPGQFSPMKTFLLANCPPGSETPACVGAGQVASGLTSIGGAGQMSFGTQWDVTDAVAGTSTAEVYAGGDSVFAPGESGGAALCHRTIDRVTDASQPLWPWPMNQRIEDAMVLGGYEPVDVTAEIEAMFGEIPAACRTNMTGYSMANR